MLSSLDGLDAQVELAGNALHPQLELRDRLERSINDGFVVNDPQRGKSVILSFEFFGLGGVGRSGAELIRSP